jgi:hypothetical protein
MHSRVIHIARQLASRNNWPNTEPIDVAAADR